jgi:hypothetical protein
MLVRAEKPITKEQYERAQLNSGYIAEEDMGDIFNDALLYGYGVYSPVAYVRYNKETKGTAYVVEYITSTCCD